MNTKEVFQRVSEYFNKRHLGICSLGRTAEECFIHLPSDQILYLDCLGSVTDTAIGVAIGCPDIWIDAFETDGSFLSNMAAIHTLASLCKELSYLTLFIFDNRMLESGGGKNSRAKELNWTSLFAAWNLSIAMIHTYEELDAFLIMRTNLSTPQVAVLDIDNTYASNSCTKNIDGKESKYMFKRYVHDGIKKGIVRPCVKN